MIRTTLAVTLGLTCISYGQDLYRAVCWSDENDAIWQLCNPDISDQLFSQISVGQGYTLGLTPGGGVIHWGDCETGTCFIPAGTYTELFTGPKSAYLKRENGSLVRVGSPNSRGLEEIDAEFIKIEFGFNAFSNDRSYGLTIDGRLFTDSSTGCLCGGDPVELLATDVVDFALVGNGLNPSDGEQWVHYFTNNDEWGAIQLNVEDCSGGECQQDQQQVDYLNQNFPNPLTSNLSLHSAICSYFIFDENGVRLFGPSLPANLAFSTFWSSTWSKNVSGVLDSGEVFIYSICSNINAGYLCYALGTNAQNWNRPYLNPDYVQASACHAVAAVRSDSPTIFCSTDSNKDGFVDFQDLIELLSSWGPCSG